MVAGRRRRELDHCRRHCALGNDAAAAILQMDLLETVAIFTLTAAIGIIAFGPPADSPLLNGLQPYRGLLGFLVLIPLMWAGLCGNRRNAATAALIFCATADLGFRNRQ